MNRLSRLSHIPGVNRLARALGCDLLKGEALDQAAEERRRTVEEIAAIRKRVEETLAEKRLEHAARQLRQLDGLMHRRDGE